MTAAVIANPTAPVAVVLIDPATGLPYTPSTGGGSLPGYVLFASPAGANNNVNPGGGWPTSISRVDVTLAGGDADWTGLVAGTDGQMIQIFNADTTNSLTLDANPAGSVAGSTAANRMQYVGSLVLGPGASAFAVYTTGSINRWRLN